MIVGMDRTRYWPEFTARTRQAEACIGRKTAADEGGKAMPEADWKREFDEYRPWTSMEQFDREIGKYLRGRPTELARLRRYVIIEPR